MWLGQKIIQKCAWIVLAGAMTACSAAEYSVAVDVAGRVWNDTVTLPIHNADTITERTLRVFFRCDADFARNSVATHVVVETPDSLRFEEPFVVQFRCGDSPAAVLRECVARYRSRVVFSKQGYYALKIVPDSPVEGIGAIGINIVKSE